MSGSDLFSIIQSFIWLLAGVGVFIVGMNLLSGALEKGSGSGLKKLLSKISNNRFKGVGTGTAITAIIQSSSATSVMTIGFVNAGVMTLTQATSIIMGANIGTTVTGLLVSLKNDYFNLAMYVLAFAGVMMSFAKKDKIKLVGSLCCGLGLIFVGLNIMSSEQAFGNPLMETLLINVFQKVNFPLLLILLGAVFTALMQSSSASTGIVITMVGSGVMPLDLALFVVLGANIGTCVTALLASMGANENAKRVAFIHFAFNVIGSVIFAALIWIFRDETINLLTAIFPNTDVMSLQMRVSAFHVIFNVTTTCVLLPFTNGLVKLSKLVIKDKKVVENASMTLKYVDDRLLTMPAVAMAQTKKEIVNFTDLVYANLNRSFKALEDDKADLGDEINAVENEIDFINDALTKFLIKLSNVAEIGDEKVIGSYFHVLNDLERIGDHAVNFYEIAVGMREKELKFSDSAQAELKSMRSLVTKMFDIAKDALENLNCQDLPIITELEAEVDEMKRNLTEKHFVRLRDGLCTVSLSPYYTSMITRLERVADHIVNVGYSIVSPTGTEN